MDDFKQYLTRRNILVAIAVIFAITFLAQNAKTVTVTLFFWSFTTPRFLVIIVSMFIGALIGYVIGNERLKKKMQKVMEVMGSKRDKVLADDLQKPDDQE